MKIQSIDRDMSAILKGGFYRIPRFQRPYSWDPENIEDFWNDIIVNSDGDYFIGSMVVYRPTNSDTSFVVDGQQRLTTVVMILAALRNAFRLAGLSDLAAGVQAMVERKDINNQTQYTLQTESSYPYFQEYIQSSQPPEVAPEAGDEEETLKTTFDWLSATIKTSVDAITGDKSLADKVANKKIQEKLAQIRDKVLAIKVIYIDLDNEDDAYLIFETINTRGKDLSPADLIKGHLTKLLKPTNKNVDLTKESWVKMVEVIEGSQADINVTTYLHHYWLARYEYVTVKKLYKDIKRKVKRDNAKEFLTTLVSDARIYREIQEPSHRKWGKSEWKIRESLEALNNFRVKQPLPMLLAIMHAFDNGKLKQGQVEEILGAIESFHFVFTAITSQRSSGGISFMYALHARDLLRAADASARTKVLIALKKKLKAKLPKYPEFEAGFTQLTFTKNFTKQKKLIQYVLAWLDRNEGGGVVVDYSQMTIEHLAPQSQHLSGNSVGNVGNLLLCEKQFNAGKLAAKTFSEKKILLQGSKVSLDRTVKNATQWGAKEIANRAKAMAGVAYNKVWKI
jgi:hypothetical protein